MTVGGGIKSTDDVDQLLRIGADKVSVNTAAVKRPELITEIADRFGSTVVLLKYKPNFRQEIGGIEAESGRENSGMTLSIGHAKQSAWAGELLLTSVDKDGTGRALMLSYKQNIKKSKCTNYCEWWRWQILSCQRCRYR